jgi:hypothetical protein
MLCLPELATFLIRTGVVRLESVKLEVGSDRAKIYTEGRFRR